MQMTQSVTSQRARSRQPPELDVPPGRPQLSRKCVPGPWKDPLIDRPSPRAEVEILLSSGEGPLAATWDETFAAFRIDDATRVTLVSRFDVGGWRERA